jgi:hypothetical protein
MTLRPGPTTRTQHERPRPCQSPGARAPRLHGPGTRAKRLHLWQFAADKCRHPAHRNGRVSDPASGYRSAHLAVPRRRCSRVVRSCACPRNPGRAGIRRPRKQLPHRHRHNRQRQHQLQPCGAGSEPTGSKRARSQWNRSNRLGGTRSQRTRRPQRISRTRTQRVCSQRHRSGRVGGAGAEW